MVEHVKWTEIASMANVRKLIQTYPNTLGAYKSKVSYKAKVKLHGSNGGIRIDANGAVTAMSRSMILEPGVQDNAGFAAWVKEREGVFRRMAPTEGSIMIRGEWCGPGIQKGVAVASLPNKVFAVFAVRRLDVNGDDVMFYDDPIELRGFTDDPSGCYAIPWFNAGELFEVDWLAPSEELALVTSRINAHVLAVENTDPWIEVQFGVVGTGEGLVFYPTNPLIPPTYEAFKNLAFKAKGEKHATVASTKPAQADPTVVASLVAFAQLVVTTNRMEQAMAAGLTYDMTQLGTFLKWINTDVAKETKAELDASGLDPKLAAKACSDRARSWFIAKCKAL